MSMKTKIRLVSKDKFITDIYSFNIPQANSIVTFMIDNSGNELAGMYSGVVSSVMYFYSNSDEYVQLNLINFQKVR